MRQTTNYRKTFLAATLAASLCTGFAVGCANPQQEARDVARTFVTAAQDGDRARAAQVLTSQARENVGTSMRVVRNDNQTAQSKSFTVGEGEVNGDTARVPVTFTEESGASDADLHLRRENGQWRVYSVTLKSGFGPSLDVDFEHPENAIGEAFRTAGQTLGMMARGMEHGAKSFEAGFNEGYGKAGKTTESVHGEERSGATIEEVPSPTPSTR